MNSLFGIDRAFRNFRTIWSLKIPHGLFSLSFFNLKRDSRVRIHRQISFSKRGNLPWVVWFIVQCFLMYRWRWCFASVETEKSINQFGDAVETIEGITLSAQRQAILRISKRFCIPPIHLYRYGLYRQPDAALDYIYPTENIHFHRLMQRGRGCDGQLTLKDKLTFSKLGQEIGLPVIPTLYNFSRGQTVGSQWPVEIPPDGVFIKSRNGWRGIGAFSIRNRNGELRGKVLNGGASLGSQDEILSALKQILDKDDAVVQPRLVQHSGITNLMGSNVTANLRVVTVLSASGPVLYSAFLRAPVRIKSVSGPTMTSDFVVPVDLDSGITSRNKNSPFRLHPQLAEFEDRSFKRVEEQYKIPFWCKIKVDSCSAHERLSNLWAVGWDWIVTETEPFLLEGNTYWEIQQPQDVSGGLIDFLLRRDIPTNQSSRRED